jgi:hypothetical protein
MTLRRIPIAIAAAAVAAGLALAPAAGAASSHKVSLKLNGPAKGTTITGTWTEKSLGKGTLKGTLHIPVTVLTFTAKGGTFTTTTDIPCKSEAVTPPTFKGCWKVVKGTGKFKGISGGGSLFGNLDGHATYNGTLKY